MGEVGSQLPFMRGWKAQMPPFLGRPGKRLTSFKLLVTFKLIFPQGSVNDQPDKSSLRGRRRDREREREREKEVCQGEKEETDGMEGCQTAWFTI
jgi:hypothetical protein